MIIELMRCVGDVRMCGRSVMFEFLRVDFILCRYFFGVGT